MINHGVAAGDDQANGGQLRLAARGVRFEKYGMDVAFEVIHGDQRFAERHRENFAVGDAD